jgi:hypothetical protein
LGTSGWLELVLKELTEDEPSADRINTVVVEMQAERCCRRGAADFGSAKRKLTAALLKKMLSI